MADQLDGAVAIVTGGGTGIGAAVVRRLAARGVRCVVNYATAAPMPSSARIAAPSAAALRRIAASETAS